MEEKEITKKEKNKLLSFEKGGIIWSTWNFVEAALMLVLGILAIVFVCQANGDSEKLTGAMSTMLNVVGIFLIIGGALKIVANFMPIFAANHLEAMIKAELKEKMSYDLVIGGSIELAGGIALVTMYNENLLSSVIIFISRFLGIFFGVLLLVAATSLIIFAIASLVSKLYKVYLPILEFIFAAILIALGVTCIIYLQKENVMAAVVLIVLGVVLVIAAVMLTIVTIRAIKVARTAKTVVKEAKETLKEAGIVVEVKESEPLEDKSEPKAIEENKNEKAE